MVQPVTNDGAPSTTLNPPIPMRIADTSGQDERLPPPSRRRLLIAGTVAAAAAGVLAWFALPMLTRWQEAEASIAADRVRVATVTRGSFDRDVAVQGRVVAAGSPTLFAPDAGTVTFAARAGDRVQPGASLAVIDSPEVSSRLSQEQATMSRMRADLDRARIEAKQRRLASSKAVDVASVQLTARQREGRRADTAFARQAISALDHEKAQDELAEAVLTHKHAQADAVLDGERLEFELRTRALDVERQTLAVTELERQVAALTLRSPVDGVVGNLLVADRTAVARNQGVLSVVDLSQFEVEAQVPESYVSDLAIGLTARVQSGTTEYAATLVSVSPEIIDNQVTTRLRFDGEVPSGLRQNQRLSARILIESKTDVLMVTRGQFLESGSGRIAYVLEDGVARKRAIEVGAYSVNSVEILDGLRAGDQIIVSATDVFAGADTVLVTP